MPAGRFQERGDLPGSSQPQALAPTARAECHGPFRFSACRMVGRGHP